MTIHFADGSQLAAGGALGKIVQVVILGCTCWGCS